MLADQMLSRTEYVHSKSFLHRDIVSFLPRSAFSATVPNCTLRTVLCSRGILQ